MRVKACGLATVWLVSLLSAANLAAADDLRLVKAVKNHQKEMVRRLLEQKVDVKAKQPDGATALHFAVQAGDLDTVNLLLGAGADVNAVNDYGVAPLSIACANGNAAIVVTLVASGANPNTTSPITGETVLMRAARTGIADAVKVLLDRGANVNAIETRQGQTALMWAASERHKDVVRMLIERGADVHVQSDYGFTPLLFAARTGDLDLVRFLLDAGADVNEEATDGTTALVVSTVRSHTTLAKFLLDKGADPNKGPGFTPLHWAAGTWSNTDSAAEGTVRSEVSEWSALEGLREPTKQEFVKLLLDHGANPNARAEGSPPQYGAGSARGGVLAGATPFFIAAKAGNTSVMSLLAAAGADPLLPNNQKTTPLMIAAGVGVRGFSPVRERDALEAVKLAVKLGNDVNAADASGETVLHGTAYRGLSGSDTMIQFLVENGAKLNTKDDFGWTPLAIAEGIYFGGSDTRSDKSAAMFRSLGAEPSLSDVERDGNIAQLKARPSKAISR